MGLFSYTAPGGDRLSRRIAKFSEPTFTPGLNVGRFTPRRFPERVDAGEFIDPAKAIETAVKIPIRSYEAPIAAVGAFSEGQNLLDSIANGVRDIPFVGPHLSDAGKIGEEALTGLFDWYGQSQNADRAKWIVDNKDLPNDTPLADTIQFDANTIWDTISNVASMNVRTNEVLNDFAGMPDATVGDYRRFLRNKLNWSSQDVRDLLDGTKSIYDFKAIDHPISDSTVLDFALQMAYDPTNAVLGAGVIAKGAKGAGTLLRLRESGRVAAGIADGEKALSTMDGVAAIINGTAKGVTTASLKTFVEGWVRGSGPVFRAWRNTGIGIYGATVGANALSQVLPDNVSSEIPGLEQVLDYFKRVDENRPLSDNMLFTLFGVLNFPLRGMMKNTYLKSRQGVVSRMRNDHILTVLKELGETDLVDAKAIDSAATRLFGERDSFDSLLYQIVRTAIARKAWRGGGAVNKALEWFYGNSLSELGHHLSGLNSRMTGLMERALDEGNITSRDIVDAMHHMYSNRGDIVRSVSSGVERQRWDPQDFIANWKAWEPLARQLSQVFGDTNVIVPGISDQVLTTSQVDWMLARLKDASKDGYVSARDAEKAILSAPAILRMDSTGVLARSMTRSSERTQLKELTRAIKEARKKAWEPEEWLADARQWNRLDERALGRTFRENERFDQTGKLNPDTDPDVSHAYVVLPDAEAAKAMRTAPVDTVEQLHTLRTRPGLMDSEFNYLQVMGATGYPVQSAARVGYIGQSGYGKGFLETGLLIKIPENVDIQTAAEMVSHGIAGTTAKRGSIVLVGRDLIEQRGFRPNAVELRWDAGRLSPEKLDRVVAELREEFGERVMFNDKTGTIKVLIKETDSTVAKDLEKRIEKINKTLGQEPAQQPALVQDVVKGTRKYTDGTRSTSSVERLAGPASHRWHVAKNIIESRRTNVPQTSREAARLGVAGRGPVGASSSEVIGRGMAPDDIPRGRQPTRYQRSSGREPGDIADEYSLDVGDPGEYQGRVRHATTGDARGAEPIVGTDDLRFISKSKRSGAYVDPTGRIHFWGRGGAGFDAVVADASDSATWTIIPDIPGARGRSLLDRLGDHGWRAVSRDEDGLVYLVRDPKGMTGSVEIPPRDGRQGGWTSIRDEVPVMNADNSMATVYALRKRWLGQTRPDVTVGDFGGDYRPSRIEESTPTEATAPKADVNGEDVPVNPPDATTDPALNEAVQRKFARINEIDDEIERIRQTGGKDGATLKNPNRSARIRRLQSERNEITSGVRDAEFGITDAKVSGRTDISGGSSTDEGLAAGLAKRRARQEEISAEIKRIQKETGDTRPLSDPDVDPRIKALYDEAGEISAGKRNAEYGLPDPNDVPPPSGKTRPMTNREAVVNFEQDLAKSRARGRDIDITEPPKGKNRRLPALFAIAKKLRIKIRVSGNGDGVSHYDPFNKVIILGPNFPMVDDGLAATVLTHEIGHHLRYAALDRGKDIPKIFGEWADGYYYVEGLGRTAQHKEVFLAKQADGTIKEMFNPDEAWVEAFVNFIEGQPLPPGVEEYFTKLSGDFPRLPARAQGAAIEGKAVRVEDADHPGRLNTTVNDALVVNDEGALAWMWDADEEVLAFKPMFDPSVSNMLDPAQLQKLYALEMRLKLEDPQYTLKLAPQNATPYFEGQGAAFAAMKAAKDMAVQDWKQSAASKLAQGKALLFERVYSRDLANEARQETYNEFLNMGASATEVNAFLRALQAQWDTLRIPKAGLPVLRSASHLPSNMIDDIATGKLQVQGFKGFDRRVLKKFAERGDKPHDAIRRASSRTYRKLAKTFPAKDGRGNLGGIIEKVYGKDRGGPQGLLGAARGTSYWTRITYHFVRFLLDPRWWAMNYLEADILGFARAGVKATRWGGARDVDPATGRAIAESRAFRMHQSRFKSEFQTVEDILQSDTAASGWMDTRKLGGYAGAVFDVERPQTTMRIIEKMIESNDPVIGDLIDKFGGNPEDWVKGLDELLYAVDTKGARRAIMDEAAAMTNRKELVWKSGAPPKAWQDFLDGLHQAHQKNFQDIMHVFHGNVNRSNIERLLNSPLLWWPLSYQLKAGKWVIDIMTDKMLGAQTDLLGTWGLNNLLAHHAEYYRNDPDYAALWDDHPALARTLGMMFPMTPFDMGVYMARWSRYSGSWIGEQLGLWDADKGYPHDPVNFIQRSIQLGPWFTTGLAEEIYREFR